MKFSTFGAKFTERAGILSLMEDLGNALADGNMLMMGGGNPGFLPEVEAAFRTALLEIAADPVAFRRLTGVYDPPQGEKHFTGAVAELLKARYGWPVTANNVVLTNGSQNAFFMLFNLFAGPRNDAANAEQSGQIPSGRETACRRVLLPMAPEYIGYADTGLHQDFFVCGKPRIEELGDHLFKYRVDFDALPLDDTVAAICVSRPTNPTGNVLTDQEMSHLVSISKERDIPFIIDGAYGLPFPGLVYTEAQPVWDRHVILCLSLSKLGLPAARTGIVIASEEVVQALTAINAITNLAPGSLGPMLAMKLVQSGQILDLCERVLRPWYHRKALLALDILREAMRGLPFAIHRPEGAMFLWLWLKNLPISSLALYERLKTRGVLVVSGHYFFPGLQGEWAHTHECLRITYSQDDEMVREGLLRLADEVRQVYSEFSES